VWVNGDEAHMRRALELAERGWGRVSPNPLVGAVIVRGDEVVGEGWHEGPGLPHAEVAALARAGPRARGATVYSTLEPCNRFGRTPPCTRALIDAGVERVVVGSADPNLGEDEPGVRELADAGIRVSTGVCREDAERQNVAFLTHVRTGRPFVILKMASTLDGKAAAADRTSRWITGPQARADVQHLRAWADAVAVGAGTARADDPSLTLRDPSFANARQPLRVVLDAGGRLPASGRLFDGSAPTLVATTERAPEDRTREWREAGADVAVLERDADGGVSMPAFVAALGKRDLQGLLIEGGPTLAWSAIRDGVVDRTVVYIAPMFAGGGSAPTVIDGAGFSPIGEAVRLDLASVRRMGADIRVEADVHRDR
jgi:diaminohydroxyphosphoribosylaminopyrimidine deaminase / 5-amino-6-(5-phosphoribosylamino)uracil reductase